MQKTCACGSPIPYAVTVQGKKRNLRNRTRCFTCLPFGTSPFRKRTAEELAARQSRKWRVKRETELAQGVDAVKTLRRGRKMALVSAIGGGCQICAYSKCVQALAFHHVRDKTRDLSERTLQYSWRKVVLPEVLKTVLLCHNCHTEAHQGLHDDELMGRLNTELIRAVTLLDESRDARSAHGMKSCKVCGEPAKGKTCSRVCFLKNMEKITWPSDGELVQSVRATNLSAVGRELGVSGTSVRARLLTRGLLQSTRT